LLEHEDKNMAQDACRSCHFDNTIYRSDSLIMAGKELLLNNVLNKYTDFGRKVVSHF
jgi:hypothetical protein